MPTLQTYGCALLITVLLAFPSVILNAFNLETESTIIFPDTTLLNQHKSSYQALKDSIGNGGSGLEELLNKWEKTALEQKDTSHLILVRKEKAYQTFVSNQLEEAFTKYQSLAKLANNYGEPENAGKAYHNMGLIRLFTGEYPMALEYFSQSLEIFTYCKTCTAELASNYQSIAAVYQNKGLYELALENQKKALEIAVTPKLLANIGATLVNMSAYEEAERYFKQALGMIDSAVDSREHAALLLNMGVVKRNFDDELGALQYWKDAHKMYQRLNDLPGVARSEINLGDINFKLGNKEVSDTYFRSGLAKYDSLGFRPEKSEALFDLAFNYFEDGNVDAAEEHLNQSFSIIYETQNIDLLIKAKRLKINILDSKNQIGEAQIELDSLLLLIDEQSLQKRTNQLALIQSQLDYVRQNHEIDLLEQQKATQQENLEVQGKLIKRKNMILILLSLGIIALMGLVYFFNQLYRVRKKANQDLADVNTKLQDSNEQLDRYAHLISHDLKEPLRTISSFTTMLSLEIKGKTAAQQGFIDHIKRATSHMNEMIVAVLRYSSLSKEEIAYTNVSLDQTLKQVVNNLQLLVNEKNASIEVGKLPTVLGHQINLEQLFQNLLANALHYSRPEIAPEIVVSADTKNGFHFVKVKDNGEGVSPADQERVFQLFQRGEGKRSSAQGTGIGLATCKMIAERHKGSISLQSKVGEGSTFVVMLPI